MPMSDKKQKQLIWVCFVCYISVYVAKLNYNALMVEIIDSLQVTNAAAGLVGTFFFAAYGISQFVHAAFIKRYNLRYVVACAMLGCACCNVLMTVAGSVTVMKYIWFLNGVSCSFLWCGMFGEMCKYLNPENARRSIVIMGLTTSLGTTANYVLCTVISAFSHWKLSFYIAGGVMIAAAVLWFGFITDIEAKYKQLEETENSEQVGKKHSVTKGILLCLGAFFLAAALVQFIRDGLTSWVPKILHDLYELPKTMSIFLTLGIPLVGAISNIVVVLMQRKIKDLTLLYLIFTGGITLTLGILMSVYGANLVVLTLFLFVLTSFMGAGVGALITSHVPVYYKKYFNAGALAGLSNGSSYVGSMFSTYTLGLVSDNGGWDAVFKTLLAVGGVSFVILAVLYTVQKIKHDHSSYIDKI
jgi:sugar phosphate permease